MASPVTSLEEDGYLVCDFGIGASELQELLDLVGSIELDEAGTRELLSLTWCRGIAALVSGKLRLRGLLGDDAVVLQCTLFRKSNEHNWLVTWHQDPSIPVADKIDHPELSGWSMKQGRRYVQPPAALLDRLLAVRVHLDASGMGDGPLRVVPGSHRFGRIGSDRMQVLRAEIGEHACEVAAGGLLLMRPLLLHASSRAVWPTGQRRVLHFVYGPAEPGYGLRWSDAA